MSQNHQRACKNLDGYEWYFILFIDGFTILNCEALNCILILLKHNMFEIIANYENGKPIGTKLGPAGPQKQVEEITAATVNNYKKPCA